MDETSGNHSGRSERELVFDSYARLSRVPETGELEKIDTQLADNRKVIERLGARLGEELSDGLSAWKRGVRRPRWERLLERARTGRSEGIAVWHTDRLFRQPWDLETLIDLADTGFTVVSAHGTRNLADPDDRFILRIEVAHAARSSDDTQRRTKRRFDKQRKDGIVHPTGRAFGFAGLARPARVTRPRPAGSAGEREDPEAWRAALLEREHPQRAPVPVEQVQRERAAILEGTRAVLAKMPMVDVAQEWNDAGLRTAEGHPWSGDAVRNVLGRARNAGLIEHNGVIVGRMPGEPIVPVEEFHRLRALLGGRQRGSGARLAYLASGIARCEVCRHPLSGRPSTGMYPDGEPRRQYTCRKTRGGCGTVLADVRSVDREVRGFVIGRLSDRQHAAALSAARARVADRLAEVQKDIGECQALQQALSERLGRRQITLDAFDVANEPLAADLARLGVEREQLDGGESGGPVEAIGAHEVAQQWDTATLGERRAMLQLALGREKLYIAAATRKGRGFDPHRVKTPGGDSAATG